jgi:hypothetical protein
MSILVDLSYHGGDSLVQKLSNVAKWDDLYPSKLMCLRGSFLIFSQEPLFMLTRQLKGNLHCYLQGNGESRI